MYFNENTTLFLNGRYVKAEKATTNLYGQTLHYGYGIFDGLRSYQTQNGVKIFRAYDHYNRFRKSCDKLSIPLDYNTEELVQISYQVLRRNKLTNAYLRPLAFCGPNMGLTRPIEVSLMICAWEWGRLPGDQPVKMCVSSYKRLHPGSVHLDTKVCGHYVNSTLATVEARQRGYDEALFLDSNGNIAETPSANFFYEKEGILFMAPADYILPGITRSVVMKICQELEIHVVEKFSTEGELSDIDSAFICGTATGIAGVESIGALPVRKPWRDSLGAIIQEAYQCEVLDKSFRHVII